MDDAHWPDPFDALRRQLRTRGEYIRVFEAWTKELEFGSCTRLLCAGLMDSAVARNLPADASIGFEVQTSTPESPALEDDDSKPEFRLWSSCTKSKQIEPLILSWASNNQRTSQLDPGFLATYRLTPRLIVGRQGIEWDKPDLPDTSVARGIPKSIYDGSYEDESYWEVKNQYVQDYSSLRGMSIVIGFFELWRLPEGHPLASHVQDGSIKDVALHHSSLRYCLSPSRSGDGTLFVEVRGFMVAVVPGDAPISLEDYGELPWHGIDGLIIKRGLDCNAPGLTFVYVRDTVLDRFQGDGKYSISPESGSVGLGHQWAVGYCSRYGRDLIQLEVRKLYEGTPAWVVRHYHAHCVAQPQEDPETMRSERNIAIRAKRLCSEYLDLGQAIHRLLHQTRVNEFSVEDIIRVRRSELDYAGWWSDPEFNRISHSCPLEMKTDDFLSRAKDLYRSTLERLQVNCMRRLLKGLKFPRKHWANAGSIQCLEAAVVLFRSARQMGLEIPRDARRVRLEAENMGIHARPLAPLRALNNLRQLDSHHIGSASALAKLDTALAEFGFDRAMTASGYGLVCDSMYDRVADALEYATQSLEEPY